MTDGPRTVDLWVGNFASREEFDQYFKETYNDDDGPINQFAADQGETFYDHDFVDLEFYDQPQSVDVIVPRLSYGESFSGEAVPAAETLGIGSVNCVLADYDNQFESPKSVPGKLTYLGKFTHDGKSPELPVPLLGDPIYLHPTDCRSLPTSIEVSPDKPFIIGGNQASLDLSALVPNIAERQVEIVFVPEKERWELRDLASNGLTWYRKEPLDGAFECPFNGIRFSVGDIEFDWSVEP
ncbi:MAG TPA: immunity 22 family protein [Fimbriimonas sp.]|nr:immunity 22 family protein [Fimbriimonas sp.]